MKIKIFFLSFVLIFLCVAAQELVPVRDTSGNIVVPGQRYYLTVPNSDYVGGVDLPIIENCPVEVIHTPSKSGLPVQFWPVNPYNITFYENETDVHINFPDGVTGCLYNATFWHARSSIVEYIQSFVFAGKLENDNPLYRFRFLPIEGQHSYVLAICPPEKSCIPVRLAELFGMMWLMVNNIEDYARYRVQFLRKEEEESLIKLSK